ncbi:S-type pyocin domain-containing protein [Pseudomonas sp. Z18(2022)]|uniref:S-type pyocin domain-containing protein n=1 Tax=Pseudomonas sp. Z18(2022) TaxID=2983410 RepID=UPI003FA7111D
MLTGCNRANIGGQPISREGDSVLCPACGTTGFIANIGSYQSEIWDGRQAALDGDLCICKCTPPPVLIANQNVFGQRFSVGQLEQMSAVATPRSIPVAPASYASPGTMTRPASDCVFAKSCVSVPPGSIAAGVPPERAVNFGSAALMGSTGTTGSVGRVAGVLGADLGSWAVRRLTGAAAGAGSALNVVMLAFWPRDIGDSTLYSPEQLAGMRVASTRVRFQFRLDEAGDTRVYGLHTRPGSGADRVPVTEARWNAEKSAMVAVLDGISITWAPNNGPVVNAPTPYPGTPERLDNLLVHPIPVGQETGITHYPGRDAEDVTWQDTIITFPADSGVPPLYLVFAKPAVKPLEVDTYGAFSGRPRNGLHLDHMPSRAALTHYLRKLRKLSSDEIYTVMKSVASIAIPAHIHQKYSETYGWRNTKTKQQLDARYLRGAVDSNFDAIKPYMLENGFSNADLEEARTKMHKTNEDQGWY